MTEDKELEYRRLPDSPPQTEQGRELAEKIFAIGSNDPNPLSAFIDLNFPLKGEEENN